MITLDFSGKVVLITGGGTGIGSGIAKEFADAGAKVVIGGRREEPLRKVAEYNPEAISWVQMDVAKNDDRKHAVGEVLGRHGRLDILVNNAAISPLMPFKDLTPEIIEEIVAINFTSAASLSLECLPHITKVKGNIVNISSGAGRSCRYPSSLNTIYAAGKAGLNHLTRHMAVELGPEGVRVNCVAPGATASELVDENNPQLVKWVKANTPLGRLGQPSDIAPMVLFLASASAGWITGQVVDAAGGWGITG